MTVADALGDALERFTVRVFATDLDNGAVAFARRGVYPAQALKDVPPDLVERYFTESDDEFTVRKWSRSRARNCRSHLARATSTRCW